MFTGAVISWNLVGMILWCMSLVEITDIDREYVESILDPRMFLNLQGVYEKYLIFKVISVKGRIASLFTMITVGIIGMTVIYTTYRINKIMAMKKDQLSLRTQQINRQLTISMLLNVSVSMMLDVLPVGIILMAAYFGIQMYGYAHIFFFTFEYQPLVNMVICIIFVKPCRNEFLRLFGIKKNSVIILKSGTYPVTNVRY
uniref:G protein-coupled receptor n=1 Tax=Strongyloides papillosus TaxID=174720 RepID=A0A0N5BJE3_STREA